MDDPLLVAAVDRLAELLEHLKDQLLIEKFVLSVSLDPLQQVASLAVLHYDEKLLGFVDVDSVIDLHHMLVINPSLNLHLSVSNTKYIYCIMYNDYSRRAVLVSACIMPYMKIQVSLSQILPPNPNTMHMKLSIYSGIKLILRGLWSQICNRT